jgi:hypothetical protein
LEVASAGDGLELTAEPGTSTNSIRLLIATCVVGVLVGGVGLAMPHVLGSRDKYAADRQAVVTRASDFAVTFNTYSSDKKADYQHRVKPLMTPAYYKEFVKTTNLMYQVAQEVAKGKKISSGNVQVLSAAVDTIDDDSASVLIAFNATANRDGSDTDIPFRFRWQISLRKVRSDWLVSRTDTVAPIEATVDDVTADNQSGDAK